MLSIEHGKMTKTSCFMSWQMQLCTLMPPHGVAVAFHLPMCISWLRN